MIKFTEDDYDKLHALAFGDPSYAGYKPNTQEAPNGDGKFDVDKRYAHVALKYNPCGEMLHYFREAWFESCRVHEALRLPVHLEPSYLHSCLRILDYPAGAGSKTHTDFDMFTLSMYRNCGGLHRYTDATTRKADALHTGIHFGEMIPYVDPKFKATEHFVSPRSKRQKSIVFFAIPGHFEELATHFTVGDFLKERVARSRR